MNGLCGTPLGMRENVLSWTRLSGICWKRRLLLVILVKLTMPWVKLPHQQVLTWFQRNTQRKVQCVTVLQFCNPYFFCIAFDYRPLRRTWIVYCLIFLNYLTFEGTCTEPKNRKQWQEQASLCSWSKTPIRARLLLRTIPLLRPLEIKRKRKEKINPFSIRLTNVFQR